MHKTSDSLISACNCQQAAIYELCAVFASPYILGKDILRLRTRNENLKTVSTFVHLGATVPMGAYTNERFCVPASS